MGRGRGGFWQQYTAAVVLAVLFGAAFAAGAAGVLDAAFARVAEDLLGLEDQFALIVHVRAPSSAAAAEQIGPLLSSLEDELAFLDPTPVFGVRQGVTVAGNANFFITIPEPFVTTALLGRLPEALQQLPGFNGHTWLLEPSVTVAAPGLSARDAAAEQASRLPGVRAVVRHGNRVTAVVADESTRAAVYRQLARWLEGHRIIEVRWPDDGPPSMHGGVLAALEHGLEHRGWRVLHEEGDSSSGGSPFDRAVAALADLPSAWESVIAAGAGAEEALRQVIALLDALEPVLTMTEQPDVQAERLAGVLRAGDGPEAVKDVLVRVAASMLWQSVTDHRAKAGGEPAETATPAGPSVLERWQDARTALVEAAQGAARLSELSSGDMGALEEAMDIVESLLPATGAKGSELVVLADKSVSVDRVRDVLRRKAEEAWGDASAIEVFIDTPGTVEPSPRAMLAGLLSDVRRAVAGVLALLAASAALLLDHSVVFAAWPRLASVGRRAPRWAAGIGALLFGGTYGLAGGSLPGPWHRTGTSLWTALAELAFVAVLGAAAGWASYRLAPRMSPVNGAELLAGQSLGLDDGQLLSEIVIPAGRPGVLTAVNRRVRRFP